MTGKELNETLAAIARTRGEATIAAGDYFGAMNKLQEIQRELAQAIYDGSNLECEHNWVYFTPRTYTYRQCRTCGEVENLGRCD